MDYMLLKVSRNSKKKKVSPLSRVLLYFCLCSQTVALPCPPNSTNQKIIPKHNKTNFICYDMGI